MAWIFCARCGGEMHLLLGVPEPEWRKSMGFPSRGMPLALCPTCFKKYKPYDGSDTESVAQAHFRCVARGLPESVLAAFSAAPSWTLFCIPDAVSIEARSTSQEVACKLAELPAGARGTWTSHFDASSVEHLKLMLLEQLQTEDEPARCFVPRHVLQAGKGDDASFMVFCFECNWLLLPGHGMYRIGADTVLEKYFKICERETRAIAQQRGTN